MAANDELQPLWEQFYNCSNSLHETLWQRTSELQSNLHIYHPFEYSGEIYRNFLKKYLNGPKKILFVGINSSLYGSLQTGIPFGDIPTVRDRMQLEVTSLDSLEEEGEQSSQRFWNLIKSIFKDKDDFLDRFFQNCFVLNFCPLVFIDNNGRNVSLESLAQVMPMETMALEEACLKALQEQVELLRPERIIPVGLYAFNMLQSLDYYKNGNCLLESIPHPCPNNFVYESTWLKVCKQILMNNNIFDIIRS
ncbi:single-strand selective monofunctional uracil DNA glycosylase-like [Musca autumnalis]|uniref:single-strand selective monofunctional uracil DNA glycosylase-like n=1 Tax=Musca autumnalis TaxID=221902 RepID=UPI003CF98A35